MDDKKSQVLNERSRTRLKKEVKKRIETTMIGALSSVEKYFGKLWGEGNVNQTPEQLAFRQVFEEMRTEILDKGNGQIRLAEAEISTYDVVWQKFHINLPIQKIN